MERTSPNDRVARWNERYARREETYDFEPSPPLPAAVSDLTPGRALDIACGAGRHAIYLAERGWQVVAVDASQAGIDLMLAEAEKRGCRKNITPHTADLEAEPPGFTIESGGFDLIADFYYLYRPLFPVVRAGLRPGGTFVAAIHVDTPGHEHPHGFLLATGELERLVKGWGWHVRHYHEGASQESGHDHGTAELIAQRPD